MLEHPNIVGFKDCFDDEENVYMGLELCEKGVSPSASLPLASARASSLTPPLSPPATPNRA